MQKDIEEMQRIAHRLGEELLGRAVTGISLPAKAPASDAGESGAAPLSPSIEDEVEVTHA